MGVESLPLLLGIGVAVGLIVFILWAALDAFERTDVGCLWLLLFVSVPFISLPVYVFMRFYSNRPTRRRLPEEGLERVGISRFASDIDKLRFVAEASKERGTMYDPNAGLSVSPEGFKHFSDNRVEALLEQRRFDEALDCLVELHSLAVRDCDARGRDTYLHYISRIPGGLRLLKECERGKDKLQSLTGDMDEREVPF